LLDRRAWVASEAGARRDRAPAVPAPTSGHAHNDHPLAGTQSARRARPRPTREEPPTARRLPDRSCRN
jgi:hypothetical protein